MRRSRALKRVTLSPSVPPLSPSLFLLWLMTVNWLVLATAGPPTLPLSMRGVIDEDLLWSSPSSSLSSSSSSPADSLVGTKNQRLNKNLTSFVASVSRQPPPSSSTMATTVFDGGGEMADVDGSLEASPSFNVHGVPGAGGDSEGMVVTPLPLLSSSPPSSSNSRPSSISEASAMDVELSSSPSPSSRTPSLNRSSAQPFLSSSPEDTTPSPISSSLYRPFVNQPSVNGSGSTTRDLLFPSSESSPSTSFSSLSVPPTVLVSSSASPSPPSSSALLSDQSSFGPSSPSLSVQSPADGDWDPDPSPSLALASIRRPPFSSELPPKEFLSSSSADLLSGEVAELSSGELYEITYLSSGGSMPAIEVLATSSFPSSSSSSSSSPSFVLSSNEPDPEDWQSSWTSSASSIGTIARFSEPLLASMAAESSLSSSWMQSSPSPSSVREPQTFNFIVTSSPSPSYRNRNCSVCPSNKWLQPSKGCNCVWPMKVTLVLETNQTSFMRHLDQFRRQISKGLQLAVEQVIVMYLEGDTTDHLSLNVTLWLLPKEGDRLPPDEVTRIDNAFRTRSVKLDLKVFGKYVVKEIECPECPGISEPSPSKESPSIPAPSSPKTPPESADRPPWFVPVIVFSSIVSVALLFGCVSIMYLVHDRKRKKTRAATTTKKNGRSRRSGSTGQMSAAARNERALFALALARIPTTSLGVHAGSARAYTLAELEAATDSFNPANVLGVGGFGRVYRGVLVKGTPVAVKVLIRNDRQGAREFFAEIQMLSRLHHRNLVKLLGVCHEDGVRMLVYELVPNGSVESHLHGAHSDTALLDWDKRMIIALGSARALAYLHEESNPSVIHRDFKASNILLENDYMPRVSDFGLAKSAIEGERFILSSRIMGTFGYVAPECAMTGHIQVQSDVYSYGVVLLELLSGCKPVDLTQPEGQENLVTWARPLMLRGGLDELIDPKLKGEFPTDHVQHVASIAYMCVDPEPSNRPSMGEVVQSLKLVCTEADAPPDHYHVTKGAKHPILSSGLLINFEHVQTPPRVTKRKTTKPSISGNGVGAGTGILRSISVEISSRDQGPGSVDGDDDAGRIARGIHRHAASDDFCDESSEHGSEKSGQTSAVDKIKFLSMPFVAGRRRTSMGGGQERSMWRGRVADGHVNGIIEPDARRARTVNVVTTFNGTASTHSGPIGRGGGHLRDPVEGCMKVGVFDYDTSDDFGVRSWKKRSREGKIHESPAETLDAQEVC